MCFYSFMDNNSNIKAVIYKVLVDIKVLLNVNEIIKFNVKSFQIESKRFECM